MRAASERLREFRRNDEGTAAIEFTIIAPIFFAMMFSFYDVGMLMLRQVMLNQAVDMTMREVRIAKPGEWDARRFIDTVCGRTYVLPKCKATMMVDQQAVGRLAVNLPADNVPCRNPKNTTIAPMQYSPSSSGQVMFLRVCAVASPLLPGYAFARHLPTNSAGEVQIITTTAFMGES